MMHKGMVLLLGHDKLQKNALVLVLRLGGYKAHVVEDVFEVMNLVKATPENVHSVVLSASGGLAALQEKLNVLSFNQVLVPVILLGSSSCGMKKNRYFETYNALLTLSCCGNDQLLAGLKRWEKTTE